MWKMAYQKHERYVGSREKEAVMGYYFCEILKVLWLHSQIHLTCDVKTLVRLGVEPKNTPIRFNIPVFLRGVFALLGTTSGVI